MGTITNKINKVKNTKDKIKTITNLSTVNAITLETIFKDYPKQILKEYIKIINNGTNELYNNLPKKTLNGNYIYTDDTEEAPLILRLKATEITEDVNASVENPIEPKVIEGENNIKINNQNLYVINNSLTYTYRCSVTYNNDGSITLTSTGNGSYAIFKPLVTLFSSEDYYISFDVDDINNLNRIYVFRTDSQTAGGYATTNKVSYKPSVTRKYGLGIYPKQNTSITVSNLQINVGKTKKTYEEALEQNYPVSLGDLFYGKINNYEDVIFKNTLNDVNYNSSLIENEWYIKKEVGKIDSYNDELIETEYKSSTKTLSPGATVYYGLDNPYYIHISLENFAILYNQLENIYNNAKSYNNETNITQNNGNLSFLLDVSIVEKIEW